MKADTPVCSQDLIDDAQHGDRHALEKIVCMHQPLLWSLAKRLSCSWISLEELVQAGNVGLLHALRRYSGEWTVKLTTYAVPWILGEMRRAMKRSENCACSLDESIGEDNGQTLYDTLSGCETIDIAQVDLRMALSRLEQNAQVLICLRYFRDRTQKEAALLMGKSQAQISRMESRALLSLRTMLREA